MSSNTRSLIGSTYITFYNILKKIRLSYLLFYLPFLSVIFFFIKRLIERYAIFIYYEIGYGKRLKSRVGNPLKLTPIHFLITFRESQVVSSQDVAWRSLFAKSAQNISKISQKIFLNRVCIKSYTRRRWNTSITSTLQRAGGALTFNSLSPRFSLGNVGAL